jgi:integral membrane protein
MNRHQRFLKQLRTLGIVEGCSTLVLFGIAMPMKYAADMPLAVTVVGAIHGLLFVALSTMFLLAIRRVPIPGRIAALGIAAAVVPFGPFVMDGTLGRFAELKTAQR